MKQKIGIFSGTFDPVHEGHLAFAREAIKACNLDKVYLLVEPQPRRKQGVRGVEHRRIMVSLAIVDSPELGDIILGQTRFTAHETLPVLQSRLKGAELYLLMGDDALDHLADWPHVEELISSVCFIIGLRRHSNEEVLARIKAIESTRGLRLRYELFQAPEATYASSKIRLALKRGHQAEGLPTEIEGYIEQEGLYVSESASSK